MEERKVASARCFPLIRLVHEVLTVEIYEEYHCDENGLESTNLGEFHPKPAIALARLGLRFVHTTNERPRILAREHCRRSGPLLTRLLFIVCVSWSKVV